MSDINAQDAESVAARWWNDLPEIVQFPLTVLGCALGFCAPVLILWLACTVGAR